MLPPLVTKVFFTVSSSQSNSNFLDSLLTWGDKKFSKFFANNVLASFANSPGKLSKPTTFTPSTLTISFRFANSQLPPVSTARSTKQNQLS